jgi:hypothetical protein
MDVEVDIDLPCNGKGYFDRSKSQRYYYRNRLKDLLLPAISYARTIGLEPLSLKFVEAEKDESFSMENEKNEKDRFMLSIEKRENSQNVSLRNVLRAKDNSFMSDKNYQVFKNETNLKQIPSLFEIKKQRSLLNRKFDIISTPNGTPSVKSIIEFLLFELFYIFLTIF